MGELLRQTLAPSINVETVTGGAASGARRKRTRRGAGNVTPRNAVPYPSFFGSNFSETPFMQ